ncbi:MAG: hypothetical protein AYK23_04285 [Candidatus Proteinoplasmatales archaeon SG8-5]|nr:MAG: hypothetical protein AYK23_04285 [Candidatus Proteinoplasmatales archaeon SG8-5]
MGSKAPAGVVVIAIISIGLGGYLLYAGSITAMSGLEIASTGGDFEDILETLGGFWQILGIVFVLLGILCFLIAFGLLTMREWGRKNGYLVHIIIAALGLIMGMITAFFDIPAALPSFAVVAVSGACFVFLWSRGTKDTFEFHGGIGKREAVIYKPNVVMRHKAVRTAAPVIPANMRKCPNCDTVNPVKQDFCRMCGTELD